MYDYLINVDMGISCRNMDEIDRASEALQLVKYSEADDDKSV